jgi:hypothetical protein
MSVKANSFKRTHRLSRRKVNKDDKDSFRNKNPTHNFCFQYLYFLIFLICSSNGSKVQVFC